MSFCSTFLTLNIGFKSANNFFFKIITFFYVDAIQYHFHTIKPSVCIATSEKY